MDVSIVIVTYNTRALTLACLEDLFRRPPAASHDIWVVDNASTDGTAEAVRQRFPAVQVVSQPANLGFSSGCNRGAREARGTYVCFLNSDTSAAGPAIDRLIQWLESHPRCGIVGPEFRNENYELIQMSWGWDPVLFNELIQQYFAPYALRRSRLKQRIVRWLQRKTRRVQILCGAGLVIRKQVFDQIRGFDQNFELYFEDSDLCRRCREAGWDVYFYSEAHLIHHLGQSTKESWSLTPLVYRQSQIYFYRKHAPAWSLPLLKFYLILKWLRLWVKSHFFGEQRARIQTYLKLFGKIIREQEKIVLSGRYFD